MSNAKKGFTLVELLVVIAIIGILSSVVVTSLNSARVKTRDAKRLSDIKQIQLALEMYQDANSHYPTDITSTSLSPYLSLIPTDPSTGAAYKYAYYPSSDPTSFHLGAVLEDASNSNFSNDKDCNSLANPPVNCPSSVAPYTGGFDGTSDSTNKVYDVTN
jgi:general secretion pathway protein G